MESSEKTVHFKDLGEVLFKKSNQARRLRITVKPFKIIQITVPIYVSFQRAEEFLHSKENWIRQNLKKVRNVEKNYTIFDYNTLFTTRDHQLEIIKTDHERAMTIVKNKKIQVLCPESYDVKNPAVQNLIRMGIEAAWRKEAKKYLLPRLKALAGQHRFEYNKAFIKNNRSRWGSCSQRNNINLSLHLMRLPDTLIDYVLLHELAHTIHKNHSKAFWELLDKRFGDAKKMDRELKKFRIDIY